MGEYCALVLTVTFVLLAIVIIGDALGLPGILERGVVALEQIAAELTKQNEPIELPLPETFKIGFITETEDK